MQSLDLVHSTDNKLKESHFVDIPWIDITDRLIWFDIIELI